MLTIFTIPKAFKGNISIIQTNAIRSWTLLRPECEIILFGKDEGTAEIARKLDLKHVPEVECNEYGTPLVSSMFSMARDIASHNVLCYVNADIVLLSDFLPAVRQVTVKSCLMVGQRWDLDINENIAFDAPNWETLLRNRVKVEGKLHPVSGIDYFVFPLELYPEIPPFAIGRTVWDNWMIYQARKLKACVIDATSAVMAIHQNHDYSHHALGDSGVWKGPEAIRNKELMGRVDNAFNVEYATELLTPQGLKPATTPRHIYFRMRAWPVLHPGIHFLLAPFKIFERLVRTARSRAIQLWL